MLIPILLSLYLSIDMIFGTFCMPKNRQPESCGFRGDLYVRMHNIFSNCIHCLCFLSQFCQWGGIYTKPRLL